MADTQGQTKSKKFNDFHSHAAGKQKTQDLKPGSAPNPTHSLLGLFVLIPLKQTSDSLPSGWLMSQDPNFPSDPTGQEFFVNILGLHEGH